ATKDSVLQEMADSHGADMNALGRVEDVVAVVDSLTKAAFDEIQQHIGRSRGEFHELDQMLDTLSSSRASRGGTNASTASLTKDVEEDITKSQKFMDGIRPILGQMKEDAAGYEKKDRELTAEFMSKRQGIVKTVSDIEKEGNEERAQVWKDTMKDLSEKNAEFQRIVSEARGQA
ncbi:hypothetical protein FOZ62_012169, partial [Perkinsus olseni]